MTGMIVASLVGLAVGVSSVLLAQKVPWQKLRPGRDDEVALTLSDPDRERVAQDFAVHVSAVDRKVSEFADALAGGDAALRNRLRRFERGGDQQ